MYFASTLVLTALAGLSSASTGIVHFTNSSSTVGPTGGSVPSSGIQNPHPTAPPAKWNSTAPANHGNGTIIIVGPGQVTSTIYTTTTVCPTTTWYQGKPTTYTTTSTIVKTHCPKCDAKPTTSPNAAPASGNAPGAPSGPSSGTSGPASNPVAPGPASNPVAPGSPQPAASCPVCPVCPNGGAAAAGAGPATVTVTVTAPAAGAPTSAPAGGSGSSSGGKGGSNIPPPPPGNKPSGPWINPNGSYPYPSGSGRPHGSGHTIKPTGASHHSRPSAGTSSFLTLSTSTH